MENIIVYYIIVFLNNSHYSLADKNWAYYIKYSKLSI